MKKSGNRAVRHALMNLLLFPGMGSLLSGRWVAGIGQITLVTSGSVLMFIWFFREMSQYYGLMFGDVQPQAVGWIGETGGILFAVSWAWATITSISLFREAAAQAAASVERPDVPPHLKPFDPQTGSALAALPQWRRNGEIISRTFEFADFPAAMKFVNAVAEIAELAQHHPDVDIRWNKVTLALTTHDAGGLTEKDFAMARQCDALSLR